MKRYIIILSLLAVSFSSRAQAVDDGVTTSVVGFEPNFFVCILAGLLLAVAFQIVLTFLSVAGGITAVGDIREKGRHSGDRSDNRSHSDDDDDSDGMNIGQKISTGMGVWALVTTSVSLFFASMLAVKLSLTGANFIGVTIGLVIWAAFFITMAYMEANMISSLVGGLVSSARNGLSSVFSRSSETKSKSIAKTQAKEQAKAIRKEMEKMFNSHDIDKKVEDYISKLAPERLDADTILNKMKHMITDLQVDEKTTYEDGEMIKKLILKEADKSRLSPKDKEKIRNHVSGLKEIVSKKNLSNQDKVKQGIQQLTDTDEAKINEYQEKIKEILRSTGKDELQPEKLQHDIEEVFNHPENISNVVKAKANALDRDVLIATLSAREDLSRNDAERYVRNVEKVLNKVKTAFGGDGNSSQQTPGDREFSGYGQYGGDGNGNSGKSEQLMEKVKGLFSGASDKLPINQVYSDFTSLFKDSSGPDLKYKLKHYDREQLLTMVTSKTSLSEEQAAPVVDKIVDARDTIIRKADEVETQVKRKIDEAKQKALAAAEETRKASATAAWWLTATAIVSAIASALGGMAALDSWIY